MTGRGQPSPCHAHIHVVLHRLRRDAGPEVLGSRVVGVLLEVALQQAMLLQGLPQGLALPQGDPGTEERDPSPGARQGCAQGAVGPPTHVRPRDLLAVGSPGHAMAWGAAGCPPMCHPKHGFWGFLSIPDLPMLTCGRSIVPGPPS